MLSAVPPELLGLRWDAGAGGHVESWFAKAYAPDGDRAVWVRCTIFARPPLAPVAEAWAIAFDRHRGHVAVKSTVALGSARFAADAFDVEVDGCALSLEHAQGELASGRGALRWRLAFGAPRAAPVLHLPLRSMYRDGVPPFSKAVTPVAHALAEGSVRVERAPGDVDEWDVSGWSAMLGHNWGRANAELYAWTHCSAFDVEHLVFEAISVRVRVGPLLSPMATAAFVRYRGRAWDLSSVRALATNRGMISLRRWEMQGKSDGLGVACDVAAETDDLVGLHYPNPAGPITHCLNTKLARARLALTLPDGSETVARSRAAALEIGTLRTDHGVRMVL